MLHILWVLFIIGLFIMIALFVARVVFTLLILAIGFIIGLVVWIFEKLFR